MEAISPCLQAVRRSRAGGHLLVLGIRPGTAGPGRLDREVETAPAKIFRYFMVSSSPSVLVRCDSVAADVAAIACPQMADPVLRFTLPHHRGSPCAPMAVPRFRPGWGRAPATSAQRYSAACGGRWAPCHTPKSARRCALLGQADSAHSTVCQATADPCVGDRPHSVPARPPALLGPQVHGEPPRPIQSLVRHLAAPIRPLSRAMPARSEPVPCRPRVLEFRVASPRGPCGCSWQCPFKDADPTDCQSCQHNGSLCGMGVQSRLGQLGWRGENRRWCPYRGPRPFPPLLFEPCVRFSRTRRTDGLHPPASLLMRRGLFGHGATTHPSSSKKPTRSVRTNRVLGDEMLRPFAREFVETVRHNVTIDRTLRESVRAQLPATVSRILNRHSYPRTSKGKRPSLCSSRPRRCRGQGRRRVGTGSALRDALAAQGGHEVVDPACRDVLDARLLGDRQQRTRHGAWARAASGSGCPDGASGNCIPMLPTLVFQRLDR